MTSYDDDYQTCLQTYAVLRVFSGSSSPQEISTLLDITPTNSFASGDPINQQGAKRKQNGWFFSTETKVDSRDSRRHLDKILSSLSGRRPALVKLRLAGAEIDISCYWVSIGQGGPIIGADQMKKLGFFGIDVWWDIYFGAT